MHLTTLAVKFACLVAAAGLIGLVLMAWDLVTHLSWRVAAKLAGIAVTLAVAGFLCWSGAALDQGGHDLAGGLCHTAAVLTFFSVFAH